MLSENVRYFAVTVRGGHCGEGRYIPMRLPVTAAGKKEASDKVLGRNGYKKAPRVKVGKDGKATVLGVDPITWEELVDLRRANDKDAYFQARNIQEQRRTIDLDERIIVYRDKYADEDDRRFRQRAPRKNVRARNDI